MAVQKNFVVKNGLEVDTNLIVADAQTNKVGIGTTVPLYTLHVNGGIGATSLNITGIVTFNNINLNGYVNAGGTTGQLNQFLISTGAGVTWSTLVRNSTLETAALDQDTFIFEYEVGSVEIYINGVKLSPDEFTADDGETIILNDPCFGGENVEILAIQNFPTGGGSGSTKIGIATEGGTVGTGVTLLDFRGAGISTVTVSSGIGTINITGGGIATYASTAGIATYATSSGIATYASTAGIATYATSSGIATYATSAGIATYATSSGIATYATSSGIATSVLINPGVGISTEGGTVGTGVTLLDFRGAGISTVTVSSGIGTINITGGSSSSTPDISPVMMGMIF